MRPLRLFPRSVQCGILLACAALFAHGAESEDYGFSISERFQTSINTLGAVNVLDSSVGYKLNSYFGVYGGLPVYFVRPSNSTTAATGSTSSNGIGNVYGQARFTFANPVLNYETAVTGTAPTGNQSLGLSTGHATVDWSNYFDRSFFGLTPFVNLGIANSVSDTMFLLRPYTSYGLVTHVEGGARYRLVRILSVGASAYDVVPSGQQTVVSRIVKQGAAGQSNRQNHGVFESANSTTGPASIAADHGLSVWAQVRPVQTVAFYAVYSHSIQYSLDTVSLGVTLNLGRAIRSLGI